jgi:biotin transport system substrate-specific component
MALMSSTSPAVLRSAFVARSTTQVKIALVVGGVFFLSLMAQIALPIPGSPVPVTGQTLGALLIGTAYGASLGFTTFATYLIVGFLGAPIFASGSHGIARMTGATGGYLVGMLLATALTGYLAQRKWDQKIRTVIPTMILGDLLVFGCGMYWLHHVAAQSWSWTFAKGFTPFLLGEVIKIAIASTALPACWKLVPIIRKL